MGTCFVIQPFDGGKFDKRYEDVFAPAIRAADLEPYRVDRDPSVSIPIEDIQRGIENATACLADITTDNPNVWFELGYAIAAQKEVAMICCSDERTTKFPFDVQHRTIITYRTESSSDFEVLRGKIEARLKAMLQRREKMRDVAELQPVATVEGLNQHQMAVLVSVAEVIDSPEGAVASYQIKQAMNQAGFTDIATTLGLKTLLDKDMLRSFEDSDINGNQYACYRLTNFGLNWLLQNEHNLVLTRPKRQRASGPPPSEEIPF